MISINPINTHFGAEITGLTMHATTAANWFPKLREAFTDYGLLVIRGNDISMADQVELGRSFCDVQLH